MTFEVSVLTLTLVAPRRLAFPPFKASNVIRGKLGMLLPPEIFSPKANAGPSGFADQPRPFVLRTRHLDGTTVEAGQQFSFNLNLFQGGANPIQIDFYKTNPTPKVRVDFLTPTELKHLGRIAPQPEFPILFARIRDRVSTLRALYGPGPLDIDFRAIAERAAKIRMTSCDIKQVEVERTSTRTGQTHSIGGFIGTAEYEGELGEFMPYLEAAHYTGVGRHAVWGKGELVYSM